MIKFIQKYQWYFYVVITTVIVISFSFFGTYGSLAGSGTHELPAFTAVNGDVVTRGEMEEMALFIGTDSEDKKLWGSQFGPNFLNDGVIANDILATGLAELMIQKYQSDLKADLDLRHQKEERFKPYTHPEVPFVSADTAWNYFAPAIKQNLETLKNSKDPLDQEALKARIFLYLGERQFPAPLLMQVLAYQQKQYGWLKPDPNLSRTDLSLFGYHSMDDWFGPRFTRLMAQFIINASIVAEEKGYRVSKDEAWADLVANANKSYDEISQSGDLHLSRTDYLNEQLRRMGIDNVKASKIWQKVLLFRRLFNDIVMSQIIDPQTVAGYNAYGHESVKGDFYHLPDPLHLSDMKQLALFETYYEAATGKKGSAVFAPAESLKVEELVKTTPELVQKRYMVALKAASDKALEGRVSVRDTLAWELEEKNFDLLKKEFAEIGIKEGGTPDQRLAALDSLDDKMRGKVDEFARKKIVESHPEWIEQALEKAKPEAMVLNIRLKGGKAPLPGVNDRTEAIKSFDQAKLNQEFLFTQDKKNFYKITVLDRSPNYEVLTFKEAMEGQLLEPLLTKKLEPFFATVKDQEQFKNKNLEDVKVQVAEAYYEPLLKSIKEDVKGRLKEGAPKNMIADIAAEYRFHAYAHSVKNAKDKKPFIAEEKEESPEKLNLANGFQDQFKWIKEDKTVSRSGESDLFDKGVLFALKPEEWSAVMVPPNGDVQFFQLKEHTKTADPEALSRQIYGLKGNLGAEAARIYMADLLKYMKEKKAISFDYINAGQEPIMGQEDV